MIAGGNGTLGRALATVCGIRRLAARVVSRAEMDVANSDDVIRILEAHQPWAVINAAGYVKVDDAETETYRCMRDNVEGPVILARACAERQIPLVTFSSDLVFDGRQRTPYREEDQVNPLNLYGRSKADAEERVLRLHPQSLVVRTSAFFGPWDNYNFVNVCLARLSRGEQISAPDDAVVSPTYVPDLVNTCLDLLLDGVHGLIHLASRSEVSWAQFAWRIAEMNGFSRSLVNARPLESFGFRALRPCYSALSSTRGVLLPPLEDALTRHQRDWEASCSENDQPETVPIG